VLPFIALALIHAAKPEVISSQKIGGDTVTVSRQALDPDEVQILWRRSGPGHPDERRILYRGRCELGDAEMGGRACRVSANAFEVSALMRYAERSWRFQLSPLRLAAQGLGVWQGAGGAEQPRPHFRATWDWQAGTGGGKTMAVPRDRYPKGTAEEGGRVDREFLSVPVISTPEAYRKDGWKSVPLGSCGLEVGGAKAPGFLLQGARKGPAGLAFKALLMSEKELLVEVYGAAGAGGPNAANWLHDDHLEVWAGREPGEDAELGSIDAIQWGIRLSDGAVFPAFGKPRAPLKVERAARGEAVVLKIALPPEALPHVLAISYSKGSPGAAKVESLLGTSALCFGASESLGVVTVLPERFGRCEVRKGALELSMELPPPGDQPLLTGRDVLQAR